MGLFELLLLSVGLAMDAFAVSICKGLAAKKITSKELFICGAWFGFFQGAMPLIGYLVGSLFEKFINMVAPWVAFVLLSIIGGNMIKEALSPDEEAAPGFDIKTMFMMAVATSIDALAVGITFVLLAVAVIGVITFLISTAGVKIGSVFGSRYRSGSEIMGGTILIFIGLRSLITHLDSSNTLSDTETLFGMLIPLAGTLAGAAVIYAARGDLTGRLHAVLVGLSSGIMFSIAVWGMIEPAITGLTQDGRSGIIAVTICFMGGVLVQILMDRLIPHTHIYSDITEGPESRLSPAVKVLLKEVIHHTPEGIALGAIYAAHFMKTEWVSSTVAIVLAVAIALQNIPEAIGASLPLRQSGTKTGKAFLLGVASGIPIPLLGMITVVVVVLFPAILPYTMAVAGGALIYTTIEEIPQIASGKDNDMGAFAFVAGFAAIMLMIFLKIAGQG